MRKAQLHMAETIAILFVFFLMIGFGFIFYAKLQKINAKDTQVKNNELASIEVTQRISFLPELQCSFKNVITDNCIDVLKLDALAAILKDPAEGPKLIQDIYFEQLRYSNITVVQIYPLPEKRWTLYENVPKDSASSYVPVPISLYNATTKSYAFGVLEVRFYS
jgi:hypothetical protein